MGHGVIIKKKGAPMKHSTTTDKSYSILTQAKVHVIGSPCSSSETQQTGSAGSSRNVFFHILRFQLVFLFVVSMFALLAVAGCSDSDSDPALVLEDAQWVAFQDGDGEWEEIEVPDDLIFTPTVNDPDGRYGLAILIASADSQSVRTITLQTTTDEIPGIDFSSFLDQEDISLEVTVAESSLDAGEVELYVGDDEEYVWDTTPETFYPYTTPYDLVATLTTNGLDYPSQMIVREFNSSDQATFDFDTYGDVIDLSGPYTFTFDPGAYFPGTDAHMDYFDIYLRTANNTVASLGHENTDGATSVDYSAPADLSSAAPGGVYLLELDIDLDEDSSVFYYEGFTTHGAQTLNIPDSFDGQCVSDTATGSMLPGMAWTGTYTDAIAYVNYFTGEANGITYSVTNSVTAGRQGADTSMTMPDLSSADTWYSLWSIPTNAQASSESAVVVMSSESIVDLFPSNLSHLYLSDCPPLENGAWIATFSNYSNAEGADPL